MPSAVPGAPERAHPDLFERRWESPGGDPRAIMLVIHGLSEHSGRYAGFAGALGTAGFETRGVDLYGHGRSPGRRGHVRDFDADHLGAVDALVTHAERERSGVPMFLLGHSLGGLVAARWVQTRVFASRLHGLILVAPFVESAMRVPAWKRAASTALAHLKPSFTLPTGIRDSDLFRTPAEAERFAADELVQRRISAGHWNALTKERERLVAAAGKLQTPTLVLLAGEDRIVSLDAARAFAAALPSATVLEYDGAFHALHHDPVAAGMTADLLAWAEARLGDVGET
ncbi:MAG: lysophospholipase [Gemmatimonadota bacterium]